MIQMTIIEELMKRKGIQQKELSYEIQVSQPTVSDWVKGKKKPRGINVTKLANYFHVSENVIKGLDPLLFDPIYSIEEIKKQEQWEKREALRRDPKRKVLFDLAENGSDQDIDAAVTLLDALRKTNPDFYDGDDFD